MKPVKNTTIKAKKLILMASKSLRDTRAFYRCKHCGEENSGMACYHETASGEANLMDLDGTLENYETTGYGDCCRIASYYCSECDSRAASIGELFEEVPPEDEEEEDAAIGELFEDVPEEYGWETHRANR